MPLIVPRAFHPLAIIRVNSETYEPTRGPNGLCTRAETSKATINQNEISIKQYNDDLIMEDFYLHSYDYNKREYIFVNADEPGMFIGLIKEGNAMREFNGYLDKEASKRKIIRDVFVKGDKAFLTGELCLKIDKG